MTRKVPEHPPAGRRVDDGITPAPPTFNWAKPAALQNSLFGLGHGGLPGWATALGYTLPGAK